MAQILSDVCYKLIEHYQSNIALVSSVPITTGAQEAYKVIFSERLGSLCPGELIRAFGDVEVTRAATQFCSVVGKIVIGSSPTATPAIGGTQICADGGNTFNHELTQGEQHMVVMRMGNFLCEAPMDDAYVNFCIKAQSSNAQSSWALAITSNGFFVVDRYG